MTTTWIAAHRSAVLSPHEDFHLFEPRGFTDQTVRQSLRLAGGGDALRIRLTNRYGKEPLDIGGAHLATRTRGSGIDPATDTPLTFSGAPTATIPAGEELLSDPVERPAHAGEELVLSLHLPGDTGPTTYAAVAHDTGHTVPGNQLSAEVLHDPEELTTSHLIAGVDVLAPADTRIAVADPGQPTRIRAEFNAGDGLHVNDAGAKAIADAIDTTLLTL